MHVDCDSMQDNLGYTITQSQRIIFQMMFTNLGTFSQLLLALSLMLTLMVVLMKWRKIIVMTLMVTNSIIISQAP